VGAALAAAAGVLLAGCATTVAGHGQLAATGGATTSPGGSPGATRSGPGLPSLPLPPGGHVDPDPEIPDSPCDVLKESELKSQFGQDADIDRQLDSCKITSADGTFLSFNAYASLTLTSEKNTKEGRPLTIGGQPAYIEQNDHYIVVGRSKNPDDPGILTCYVGFSGGSQLTGIQLATRLFEQLLPHYVY
jgi:Protein of unknown function (DUF3558)